MNAVIYNKSCWVEHEDGQAISLSVDLALRRAGFWIIDSMDYSFKPIGFTKVWLLGESHCALHSFPEEGKVYIELSSCAFEKYNIFWNYFSTNYKINFNDGKNIC